MIFFNKVTFSKYLAVWLLSVSTKSAVALFFKLSNIMDLYASATQYGACKEFFLASTNFLEISFKTKILTAHSHFLLRRLRVASVHKTCGV